MLAKTTAARTVSTQHSAQRRGRRRRRRGDRGVSASTSTFGDTVWRWESIGAAPRVDGVQMAAAALLVLHQIWRVPRLGLGVDAPLKVIRNASEMNAAVR